jgi:hypothetical protein
MKTHFVILGLMSVLLAHQTFAGTITVVAENTVDLKNLFNDSPFSRIDYRVLGVPENIAHIYTLRSTYSVITGAEAVADVEFVPAGCDSNGYGAPQTCHPDLYVGRLDFVDTGSQVRWELIDATTGSIVGTKSAKLMIPELSQQTQNSSQKIDFSGQNTIPYFARQPQEDISFVLSTLPTVGIFYSSPFLDELFDEAKLVIEPVGESKGSNRYRLAGIEFSGITEVGTTIPVQDGARFPSAGVWLTLPKVGGGEDEYLAGAPNSSSANTDIVITNIEKD